MAGGMRRGRDHGTLAERAARSRAARPTPEVPDPGPAPAAPRPTPPTAPAPPTATASPTVPRVRHCWVVGEHGPLPGLLLGWEQRAAGWWGRVVHPVESTGGHWVVVEEWLPAERLRAGPSGP